MYMDAIGVNQFSDVNELNRMNDGHALLIISDCWDKKDINSDFENTNEENFRNRYRFSKNGFLYMLDVQCTLLSYNDSP